jgi:prolyl oligopeptidase PreP (S9A serine peptidase family)
VTFLKVTKLSLRASPTRVQQKFANEQDGTKRMFFVVAGRRAKVLK